MYIKNNELFSKYREIEKEKTKIYFKGDFFKYYDEKFIEYMFLKGYWIDFCHNNSYYEFLDLFFQDINLYYCSPSIGNNNRSCHIRRKITTKK